MGIQTIPICYLPVLQVRSPGAAWLSWFSDLGFIRPKLMCWEGVFFSGGSRDESASKFTGIVGSVQFHGVIGLRSHFLGGYCLVSSPLLEATCMPWFAVPLCPSLMTVVECWVLFMLPLFLTFPCFPLLLSLPLLLISLLIPAREISLL